MSASQCSRFVCAPLCPHLCLNAQLCGILGARVPSLRMCISVPLRAEDKLSVPPLLWWSPRRCVDLWAHMAGDDPSCRPLWPKRLGLVWPPPISFLSFSGPLCPPAQSVTGTLELSRAVVFRIWDLLGGSSSPLLFSPPPPQRAGTYLSSGKGGQAVPVVRQGPPHLGEVSASIPFRGWNTLTYILLASPGLASGRGQ